MAGSSRAVLAGNLVWRVSSNICRRKPSLPGSRTPFLRECTICVFVRSLRKRPGSAGMAGGPATVSAVRREVSEMNSNVTNPPTLDASSSLSERAYRLLRHKILYGDLEPSAKLKMDTLQRETGLSSSPLREALNRLAAEGLVQIDENKGFRSAPISVEDFEDITALRLVVEPAALVESISSVGDEWEGRIVAAFHRLRRSQERMPPPKYFFDDDWTARHKDFHMALYSGCSSRRLYQLCWNLFDQAQRYRRFSAKNRKTYRDTTREHQELMEAALARDVGLSKELIRKHITTTSETVRALLSA
jgi:GntR family transcriptional regulator, carbon starvation induced regulator